MAATIHDVAKYSGLSLGTVSKYINGKPIKEVNRKKIEKAIAVLNYKPNSLAKGLRNSRSFAIGVLIPMLSSSYCTTIISSIEKYLLPLGYCVIVCECHDDAEMEIKKAEFLLERMIDGIILLPYSPKGRQLELIQQNGVPVVVIDQMIVNHEADSIVLDNAEAIFKPTDRLLSLGHRDIALLIGNSDLYTSQERLKGYCNAFRKHNIPVPEDLILNGNYTMSDSYKVLMQVLNGSHIPTALISSNYDMTLGTLLTINTLHLKIPEDISIVGFDNLILSQFISPALYTIEQPMEEMGIHAAELLYRRIQGDYSDFPCVLSHSAKFIAHDSIRPVLQSERREEPL